MVTVSHLSQISHVSTLAASNGRPASGFPQVVALKKMKGSEVQDVLQSLRMVHLMTVKSSQVPVNVTAGQLSYGNGL